MFDDGIFMHNFNFMFFEKIALKYMSTRCFTLKTGTKSMSFFHFICNLFLHFCLFYSRSLLQIQKCTFILTCGYFRALSRFQISVLLWSKLKLEMFIPALHVVMVNFASINVKFTLFFFYANWKYEGT